MNVQTAAQSWLRGRFVSGEITSRSRTLLEARLAAFVKMYGDRPVASLDRTDMKAWARRVGHLSQETRRLYLSTLRCFLRWCVDEGLLAEDPSKTVAPVRPPRRAPRARKGEEVVAIYQACRTPRERAIVCLMVQLGLRAAEVGRLEMADWDQHAGTILVRGKAGHERVLPMTARAAQMVLEYRGALPGYAGPIICDEPTGRRPLSGAAVSRIVTRVLRDAGVKTRGGDGITPHTLRHTAASDVLDRCGNVRTVQGMLGHQWLQTTAIYLRRASLEQLREAMEGRDYSVVQEVSAAVGPVGGRDPTVGEAGTLRGSPCAGALSPGAGGATEEAPPADVSTA